MTRLNLTLVLELSLSMGIWATAAHGQEADDVSTGEECGAEGSFQNLELIALTDDQRLVCVLERAAGDAPDVVFEIGRLRGLERREELVGIDFRPADRRLYGLGDEGGTTSTPRGPGCRRRCGPTR
jgi:hypothetical protein